ncbi:MAG TPA: M28 family peptidase [Candidatus Acidoferrales bacterium]|jgi:Zn-dependent M28 family amino/carboxypeptidase|nr:M28 family peptidase [Candidatus Acidoferrales bacterium]
MITFTTLPETRVEARLTHFSKKDSEREEILKGYFVEAGSPADSLTEQKVSHEKFPNLICVLPGSTDAEIIVGAHFDHASEGSGVVDNWSGAAMLPSLIESLPHSPRKHKFVFVGFSGEEDGLVGSDYYAKKISDNELRDIRVMVNLDCLGLGPISVWLTHSNGHFADLFYGMSKAVNIPLTVVNADQVADEDSSSFRKRKIPTLMLHSVDSESIHILHSPRDNISAIKMKEYHDSYRLIAAYLAYLDSTLN